FFFQAEDGIRDFHVTGVQTCALPICAGLDVARASGHMVVDIGGGTVDVAVISLGEEVLAQSIRMGGDKFDEAIIRYVRREYNLIIGERTAEEIKTKLGCAFNPDESLTFEVRGRHSVTGLPVSLRLSQDKVYEALQEPVQAIVNVIRSVLEKTPPELAGDIVRNGMVLTGGGALMKGLPELIQLETRVPVAVPED